MVLINFTENDVKTVAEGSSDRVTLGGRFIPWFILIALCLPLAPPLFVFTMIGASGDAISPVSLVAFGVPTILIPIAYLLVSWIQRLTLNLSARTYTIETGPYPILWRRQGSLDEFSTVLLEMQLRRTAGPDGRNYYQPVLSLRAREGDRVSGKSAIRGIRFSPFGMLKPPNREQMRQVGENLARRAGWEFRDESDKAPPL